MSAPYVLLWLEGPLQAWGHDSRFGRRDTLAFPTKSGVLGLVCCALGAGGRQRTLLAEFADLDMQLEAYVRVNNNGEPVAREPLLRDFHMVGSGYDEKDPWQSLLIPKTSEGKKAVGGGSKLTHRYYLQDMAYGVALQIPRGRVQEISEYLRNPVWDLYLGRKTCVPTEIIFQGVFPDAASALAAGREMAAAKNRCVSFRVMQGEHEGEVMTINDVPVQFGQDKRYRDRMVTVQDPAE